jgi:hypothetical protein
MKKILLVICCVVLFNAVFAQVLTPNDSVSTDINNSQMVFYSLATGAKTLVSNTDWHIAVSIRPTQYPNHPLGGTSIRLNGGNGVKAYIAPNVTVSSFNNLDTTGWHNWKQLYDSDTSIDNGALNSTRNGTLFDFGWGVYNSTSHNVVGDSVFLIELPNGELFKFMVVNLDQDTAFNIRYAHIDNSGLQNLHIGKPEYSGKEFVYVDLPSNIVRDKEPASNNWDLQFLKYGALDVTPGTAVAKTGVWVNGGTQVGKAVPVDVNSNNYSSVQFSTRMNGIGWNWQQYDSASSSYNVEPALAYFVQTNSSGMYKVVFTGFGGSTTGVISFYKQLVESVSAVAEPGNDIVTQVFPNPATNQMQVLLNTPMAVVSVIDMQGKQVALKQAEGNNVTINTGTLANGIYLLSVTSDKYTGCKKFVVSH